MPSLLDLPDELLVAIFEYFAAPLVRCPFYRGRSSFGWDREREATISLSLVNKRFTRIVSPLLWRSFTVESHYQAYQGRWTEAASEVLAKLANPSAMTASRLAVNPHSWIDSLQLQWIFGGKGQYNNLIPAIIGSCTSVHYLHLVTKYETVPHEQFSHCLADYLPGTALVQAIGKLRHLIHLYLSFNSIRVFGSELNPVKLCLAEFTKAHLQSLQGLSIDGTRWTQMSAELENQPSYETSFNFPHLTVLCFLDAISQVHLSQILGVLAGRGPLPDLSFGRAANTSVSGISPAIRSAVSGLVQAFRPWEGSAWTWAGTSLLRGFCRLRRLQCNVEDLLDCPSKIRAGMLNGSCPGASYDVLESLTVIGTADVLHGWIKLGFSRPDYMPKLKRMRILLENGEYRQAYQTQRLLAAMTPFPEVRVTVELRWKAIGY